MNSFNNIAKRAQDHMNQFMCSEIFRLQSFSGLKDGNKLTVSIIQLAQAGFYFQRETGRVHCFSCGREYNNQFTSTMLEDVHDPNCCRFELNQPLQNGTLGLPQGSVAQYFSQHRYPNQARDLSSILHHEEHLTHNGVINGSVNSHSNNVPSGSELPQESNNVPTTHIREGSSETSTATTLVTSSGPSNVLSRSSADTLHISEPTTLNLSSVAYPQFSTRDARMKTFTKWNPAHTHRPEDFAAAGFFYAGYADCVRCFCCGLGLKFWRQNDIITYQHARMRPACVFNRLYKGQQYVDSVQQEVQAQQGASNQTTNQTTETTAAGTTNRGVNVHPFDAPQTASAVTPTEHTANHGTSIVNGFINGEHLAFQKMKKGAAADQLQLYKSKDGQGSSKQATAWTDHKQNLLSPDPNEELRVVKREHDLLAERTTCRVCQAQPISCIYLPCGHVTACQDCADKASRCVLCSEVIIGTANVYLA